MNIKMRNKRLTIATVTICAALTAGLLSAVPPQMGRKKDKKKRQRQTARLLLCDL